MVVDRKKKAVERKMNMAVNYASKYSTQIDERFKLGLMTGAGTNQDYDWIGVETVNVYSVPTVPLNDYASSGTSRYGTPQELGNNVQEMKVEQDRSFTFTIDRKSRDDTMMTMEAGKALMRENDEVIIPDVDTYRLAKIVSGASTVKTGNITSSNAYEAFLDVQAALDDLKAPAGGRVAFITPTYYKNIKLDDSFTKKGDMATQIAIKGMVGEVDGVPMIKVPSSYLPEGVDFVITNAACTPAPVKMEDYTIHENPPGISGWLVEGRVRFDAFVLNEKKAAIGVHKSSENNNLGTLSVTSAAGTNSGNTKLTISPALTSGNSYKYKVGDSATSVVYGQNVQTWPAWNGTADITAETNKVVTVVECDSSYKAMKAGSATVTAKA